MKKYVILTSCLLLVLILFLGAANQVDTNKKKKDGIPQVHFRVDVQLRLVDVIVLDDNDEHVTDLKPEDFEIYEEGVKQEIISFDNLSFKREVPAKTTVTVKPDAKEKVQPEEKERVEKPAETQVGKMIETPREAIGRSIVLLFDNYNTYQSHLFQAKKAAKEFISKDLLPEDRVAVIRYYGSAKILQDFTNDKGKLFEAIDTLSVSLGDVVGMPEIATSMQSQNLYGGGGAQADALVDYYRERNIPYKTDATWDWDEKLYNVMNFQDVLKTIGFVLKDIPGRKTIIFLSPGFLGVSVARTPWMFVNLARTLERMSGYNITLYSVDVTGVATDPKGKRNERWDFLHYVADKTGGKFFRNKNNIQLLLQKVNYEISHYYILGYYSDKNYDDGRFLKVDVKCKRPGTNVRTVKGLYSSRSWEYMTVEERQGDMERILNQGAPLMELPIKIDKTSTIPASGGKIVYPLIVRFPIFERYQKYDYLSYDVFVRTLNDTSQKTGEYFQEIRIEKENLTGEEFLLNFPIELPPGEYRIDVIVKNNITREQGTRYMKIKIPDKIKGFAATEPKIFTSYQSATIIYPESRGIVNSNEYYKHLPRSATPISGQKLYVDQDTYIHFNVVNFGMDLQKENTDVTYNFAIIQKNKPLKTVIDVKKYLDGTEKDVQTVVAKIPRDSLEPGKYTFMIYVKDNQSGTILNKTIPINYTKKIKDTASMQTGKDDIES